MHGNKPNRGVMLLVSAADCFLLKVVRSFTQLKHCQVGHSTIPGAGLGVCHTARCSHRHARGASSPHSTAPSVEQHPLQQSQPHPHPHPRFNHTKFVCCTTGTQPVKAVPAEVHEEDLCFLRLWCNPFSTMQHPHRTLTIPRYLRKESRTVAC